MFYWIVGIIGAIIALFITVNIANYYLPILLGFRQPKIQWLAYARHRLKLLRGIKVESVELDCPDGYLYERVRYSDGSSLYFL